MLYPYRNVDAAMNGNDFLLFFWIVSYLASFVHIFAGRGEAMNTSQGLSETQASSFLFLLSIFICNYRHSLRAMRRLIQNFFHVNKVLSLIHKSFHMQQLFEGYQLTMAEVEALQECNFFI
jgi:hypothetical protein